MSLVTQQFSGNRPWGRKHNIIHKFVKLQLVKVDIPQIYGIEAILFDKQDSTRDRIREIKKFPTGEIFLKKEASS